MTRPLSTLIVQVVAASAGLFVLLAVGQPLLTAAAPWTPHLRQVDEALARHDAPGAEAAWHAAYVAALRSPAWEGLIETGEAYLRVGEATRGRAAALSRTREVYLAALYRARAQNALDGVLRVGEAFGALGDEEVVEQCLRIAEEIARDTGDPQAFARVAVLRERLGHDRVGARLPPDGTSLLRPAVTTRP